MNIVWGPTKLGWSRIPAPLKVVVYAVPLSAGLVAPDLIFEGAGSVDPTAVVLAIALLVAAGGVWLEWRFARVFVATIPAVIHVFKLAVGDVEWWQWRDWLAVGVQLAVLSWFLFFHDVVDDYYIMLRDAEDRRRHDVRRDGTSD